MVQGDSETHEVSSWLALTGGAAIVVSSYDWMAKGSSMWVLGAEVWEVVKVAGRLRDMARYQQVTGAMVLGAVDSGEILLKDVSNHSGQVLLTKRLFHPGTHFTFTSLAPLIF